MRNMEWRNNFNKAQSELNVMAESKGWKVIGDSDSEKEGCLSAQN